MSRPEPATTLEDLAEKTGIEEKLLDKYAFLSKNPSIIITFMGFEFPCLFVKIAGRYPNPSNLYFKDATDTQKKYVPKVYKYVEGLRFPDYQEEYDAACNPDILGEYYIIPLDENVDIITVDFNDYHDCNSNNPKEWHIFRNWLHLDDECTTWGPDQDKWRRFCKLKPRERAKILWLWSQYLNLSIVGMKTLRGPKTKHLHKIRIFLILSEMENIGTKYKHFWTANYLNIINRLPFKQGNVKSIRGYNPKFYDLKTQIETKGKKRSIRVGENQIKSTWSDINRQIKVLDKIPPPRLSARCVR